MASVPMTMTQVPELSMGPTKHLDVRFPRGSDVLAAYWGFLADGGLIIPHGGNVTAGEPVSLRIQVASSGTDVTFTGTIAKLLEPARAVVAFCPDQPHDLLLSAALAETDNVPARRHRRYRTQVHVEVAAGGASAVAGEVINVSASGCCFRLAAGLRHHFAVGDAVSIAAPGTVTGGRVVWSSPTERGVAFSPAHPEPPFGVPRVPEK